MNPTRASLLSRVRDASDEAAWQEFQSLYHDLLLRLCRRRGMQEADALDVVQTVMTGLLKSLPRFTYDPRRGRFRDYLFRCTEHAIRRVAIERQRGGRPTGDAPLLEMVEAVDASSGTGAGSEPEAWGDWE